jgi:Family of unknown function (DUF5678)
MNETLILPAPVVTFAPPARSKWEREHKAFVRLLPQLLASYPNQYVAIHNGQVVDSGQDRLELSLRVLKKVGNVDIHVGFVGDDPTPISRSGVRREIRPTGVGA